jgi:hypothetical protein
MIAEHTMPRRTGRDADRGLATQMDDPLRFTKSALKCNPVLDRGAKVP